MVRTFPIFFVMSRAPQGARGLKSKQAGRGFRCAPSRPARGAWVEIKTGWQGLPLRPRRAPQGARGLKFFLASVLLVTLLSRPARGAWVEMMSTYVLRLDYASRPARGAWVEIYEFVSPDGTISVAPRKGRVG